MPIKHSTHTSHKKATYRKHVTSKFYNKMEVHNKNKFKILCTGNTGSPGAQTSCIYGTFLVGSCTKRSKRKTVC